MTYDLLAPAKSTALVRWTVLSAFSSGLVWTLPAMALLFRLGTAAWALTALYGVAAVVASILQARAWVHSNHGNDSGTQPIEWALALGGIGPNLLVSVLVSLHAPIGLGLPLVLAAGLLPGLLFTVLPVGLPFAPALPSLAALHQPDPARAWRQLGRAAVGTLAQLAIVASYVVVTL